MRTSWALHLLGGRGCPFLMASKGTLYYRTGFNLFYIFRYRYCNSTLLGLLVTLLGKTPLFVSRRL